ncbi:nickel ABC transporter permease subunit NikB [Halalkalibacterium halodurans]|uniref:Nickel import system permease protein NikB n=1 Tax=Halalkalibacterium halodurans (strain ATCC BAA-125 / DSM 18197 / FERM 7344 / JCM 9153 / C-125) TaxID=272558 RepID=Q9KFB7_HALH5|nr:nickel ABC transporter permease subunit NikB [Halalkalibacterium halodurans]MDY7221064.1 nickel ABC transporter permease subunit NikB [Halalkalibacterium halodurans]MDY7240303.1 nickel ABC transporter permease subunit NikB [Halalkalibacterium halodurans]MED4124571.1 nickel ABC transporter permease subunit NikB [Halalkalibacterium halodurans]MED4173171.1 nickel ABC transporter permease subunit NikB [Halalkalibacterium halodurans]BAB04287.1 nickel transport system (permease) [Halalkalibacteri
MVSYIAKRIFAVIPIVLFAIFIMFVFIRLSPVDPAEAYLTAANIHPTEELLAEKRHEFGLDQPMAVQYVQTIVKVFQLDFGHSYVTNQPVWDEVTARMPATLQLAVSSIFLAVLISIPLGFLSAIYKNSLIDRFSRLLSYLGASIPQFWLGYLLIFFFSVKLNLFPVEGRGSWAHLVLPTVTLSLALIAIYTRLLRASVLEQMQESYVLYARTRGIKEKVIMVKHVLKLAISPVITGLGMNVGKLLTGTIIVEQVFSWPGFGRYFVDAIFNRDIPVIQCYVLLAACLFIVCNLIVDLVQLAMDPRISSKGRAEY